MYNALARFVCARSITLGARDFSSAVSVFCQVFIVTRAKSFSRSFAARGFGQHRKFPPHARKTSGTQGRGQLIPVKIFDRSSSGFQVIGQGAGNDFHGPLGQALPLPLRVSLSRARSFFHSNTCKRYTAKQSVFFSKSVKISVKRGVRV